MKKQARLGWLWLSLSIPYTILIQSIMLGKGFDGTHSKNVKMEILNVARAVVFV